MKTLRRIQNTVAAVAMFTTIVMMQKDNATPRELWASLVIVALMSVMLVSRFIYEEKGHKNNP